jgi:AraC-like DNA-binding protein
MLYASGEARRWNGRYVCYCPIGLVFSAVTVPESSAAVIAGPAVIGDLQDTLADLPEHIDKEAVRRLAVCSTDTLHHLSSLLEMAVYGLRYRPTAAAYDRNDLPITDEAAENAQLYNSFPYMREHLEELRTAVKTGDKNKARETLNGLLRYVYSPHPDQFVLIRSRAVQTVQMLSAIAADTEGGENEADMYRTVYLPALINAPSLEEMDAVLAEVLHHFVDYAFDFSAIRHSDTVYRVIEYIRTHYSRRITLEEIAAYVYLSPSYLSSLFRKETGESLHGYISRRRLQAARELIGSGVNVTEACFQVGYGSYSSFFRAYVKRFGVSPTEKQSAVRESSYA